MRRDLTIKTGNLAGTSDFRVLASIKKGFVPSLDAVTYKTRVKRVLKALHIGRAGAHEFELARVLSDAVERVGRIHSVGIAVLEPEDKVLLTVTFDGAWESYVRVIWQKVARLLDLIFHNTEDYVVGYENSYEKWGAWLKRSQSEASFLYATPGLTVDDARYLQMAERVYRRESGSAADLRVTRIKVPTAEEIAAQSIFGPGDKTGIDPTNAGFGQPITIDVAGRPAFRHGVRSLVGLYRLADLHTPGSGDDVILHRAAHELLPEFVRMLDDGNTYQLGIARALKRFEEAVHWIQRKPPEPDVRAGLPVALPDAPPLEDAGNVQAGILSAYPEGTDHGCLLLLQFATPAALAAFLGGLRVSTEADKPGAGDIATNVAFTVEGLRAAGLSDVEIRELPDEFVQGMEGRAGILGDVRINHPRRWRLPALNWSLGVDAPDASENDPTPRVQMSAIHAVLQLRLCGAPGNQPGSDRAQARETLMAAMKAAVAVDPGVKPLSIQWLHRKRNALGHTEEHFGFLDGDGQPVLTKAEAGPRYSSNQVHLGELLCGYPNLADKSDPFAELPDRARALLKDGSFMAVRKLRQDIEALESALVEAQSHPVASGQAMTREDFLAKMMGRWPGNHEKAGQPLAEVLGPNSNDFHFNKDKQGARCPFHAHVRRANPRITEPEGGGRPPRIMRRGMSYGEPFDRRATDPQARRDSLDRERGLVFMAYNANLGEQFEVVQRWLNGGNSSGSYSGDVDPFFGIAEPGRRRFFRFENEGQTIRMALDGSDRLHDAPRPFVRLEWGAYLFAPSLKALAALRDRAAAQGTRPVLWSVDTGECKIARLREIERLTPRAAAAAWKAALEDPDAAVDFTAASIWAAIRERHGGVLDTPHGVLVADRDLVETVLTNADGNVSAKGYLPRMNDSFGVLYLGLDADQPDGRYERESAVANKAIMALDTHATFDLARRSVDQALKALVDEAIVEAEQDGDARWDLTVDARELIDPCLADFCEEWFGLNETDSLFRRAGYRWDWRLGDPPNYPGHFMSPSRYIFQPHPGPEVAEYGKKHGQAVRTAMEAFLQKFGPGITAPVTRAVLDSADGADIPFVARTVAGAMMGFLPTTEGTLRRIFDEWLREGTLWALRARFSGTRSKDFFDACNRLGKDFIPAMQLRAVPEIIWRTAVKEHTLGEGAHRVTVKPGDVVVCGSIAATQQSLEQGSRDYYHAFGGNRRAAKHPTHACPGADPALAVMLGFFSALVETDLPLRVGPGPLTIGLDGRTPAPPAMPALAAMRGRNFEAAFDLPPALRVATVPLAVIGDSWLDDLPFIGSLTGTLVNHGYDGTNADMHFATPGRLLKEMASPANLNAAKNYFLNIGPDDPQPRAVLLGGGGNDVAFPSSEPTKTRLYKMLQQSPAPGQDALIEAEVAQFIDVELFGHYMTIINALKDLTTVPFVLHAYDHPVPDGRPFLFFSGPWLKRPFDLRGITDLTTSRDIMRRLIDRLNAMAGRVAAAFPGRVHHVDLTGILANHYGDPANYRTLWDNELHPNRAGYDLLATEIAKLLNSLPNA